MKKIQRLGTSIVYQTPWITVRQDDVEFPNGSRGKYSVVDKDDFVVIIPMMDSHFYFIKQYRYPGQEWSWEFPQGKHEGEATSNPEQLAIAEFEEETGFHATSLEKLGYLRIAPGFCNQGYTVFLANTWVQGEKKPDPTEEGGLEVVKFPVSEFKSMVTSGKITDSATMSAYALLTLGK